MRTFGFPINAPDPPETRIGKFDQSRAILGGASCGEDHFVTAREKLTMSRKAQGVESMKFSTGGGLSAPASLSAGFYGNGAYGDDYEGDAVEQGGQSGKSDTDAMTVHRRKMMRRAANRRSAQLSRARKKVS